jgi:hypothetical protein
MIEERTIPKTAVPSTTRILKATLVAFAVAITILFTTVLPAEYGFDPLGAGAALGLTTLSPTDATAETQTAAVASVAPVQSGAYNSHPRIYKIDSQDFLLTPGQGFEMKYHMPKGAVMVYSWNANGKLFSEFHGEPDQKPHKDYYDSYELDDKVGKDQSHGSFTAPSTGVHGWFWENKGDQNVEMHLTVAGFFDGAKMYAGGPPEDLPVEDAK